MSLSIKAHVYVQTEIYFMGTFLIISKRVNYTEERLHFSFDCGDDSST